MTSHARTYWRYPSYWRWFWLERVGTQAKVAIVGLLAIALGIAGYLGARGLGQSDAAATVITTKRVVTIVRKAGATGSPKVVTISETITRPGKKDVVTVRRNGRTVVVSAPQETVTVRGPVQQRVVTKPVIKPRNSTVLRTVTTPRPTTVTAAGGTVTTPGTTVTTAGPTVTVTRTTTEPARTVTQTTTQVQTQVQTVTETVTTTETQPLLP